MGEPLAEMSDSSPGRRAAVLLGGLFAALLALPAFAGSYLLSVATLILFFAYTGQAWNVMMGFAGQLSLGHSLYVGVGAYAAAGLYSHYGIGPWAGLWLAILLCVLLGMLIGFLYAMLALAAGAFGLCAWLLKSRAGYYWLAIRENEEAAQALGINVFRWKMLAVALSSALTAVAGVFYAFYYNNLFPEQVFNISRSIEIILGPIIGGVGTLFGPILGAAALTLLADGITEALAAMGWEIPGIKQVFYGVVLLVVVMFLPNGIWPALARKLRVRR